MSAPARDVIDFVALEKELRRSLNADEKYQRENAAKLRAVSQKVGSYEEFRSLVLASNLKPLQKNDREGSLRKQPWNPVVTTSNRTRHMTSECSRRGNEEAQNKPGPNAETGLNHETN